MTIDKLFSIGIYGLYRRTLKNHCFITTYYFIGKQLPSGNVVELFRF